MAEKEVQFNSNVQLFTVLDDAVNSVVQNVGDFSNDVANGIENLKVFLEIVKAVLNSVQGPIEQQLLKPLDALIASIEDLKNIGFGTLQVWPWEVGKIAPGVDVSKLEDAIIALALMNTDENPQKYKYNSETGKLFNTESGKQFGFTASEVESGESTDSSKVALNDGYKNVLDFLDPGSWRGPFDQVAAEVLQNVNNSFKIPQLTPAQVINEINSSFDDTADNQRPTGSGEYFAQVIIFMLPTHDALREITQAFVDFFAGILGDTSSKSPDVGIQTIELGEAVALSGLKDFYDNQLNIAEDKLDSELRQLNNEKSELERQLSENDVTDFGVDEINDMNNRISAKQREIIRLKRKNEKWISEGSPIAEKVVSFGDVTIRKFPGIGVDKPYMVKHARGTHLSEPIFITHGSGFNEIVRLPMFNPGDKIVQGDFGINFRAEVVEHEPIKIENGKITSNKIKIKEVSGEIIPNWSKRGEGRADPIRRLNDRQFDLGIVAQGALTATTRLLEEPLFLPQRKDYPKRQENGKFLCTIIEGDSLLLNAIPNDPDVLSFMKQNDAGSAPNESNDFGLDTLFQREKSFTDQLYGEEIRTNPRIQEKFLEFAKSLSVGEIIEHEYLNTLNFSDKVDEDEESWFPGKALSTLLPNGGRAYAIKEVLIGDSLRSGNGRDQLFKLGPENANGDREIEGMNPIKIRIGRVTKNGVIDDSFSRSGIQVPGGKASLGMDYNGQNDVGRNQFRRFAPSIDSSSIPNWNFLRIQDLYPVYGETLDEILKFLRGVKKQVTDFLDTINRSIEFLENFIKEIENLNQKIQKIVLFLAKGLRKAGLYNAKIEGIGGPENFKQKLKSAKIRTVYKRPFKDIELEPVKEVIIQRNPLTGADEEIEVTTLKPILKEIPADFVNPVIEDTVWSELDALKYSGAFVFYAQGPDTRKFAKFLDLAGLTSGEKSADEIADEKLRNILDKLQREVGEIQVQDISGSFIDAKNATDVQVTTKIKIIFKNDDLTDEEKILVKEQLGENFDFNPSISEGTIFPAFSPSPSVGANFIVSSGDFTTATPLNFNGEMNDTQTEFTFEFRNPLPASTLFKVKIKKTILDVENNILRDDFILEQGFTTSPTTVVDIGFE